MFPEGRAVEFLVAAVVALIVVGPKDLPVLLRKFGQFMAKVRSMAAEFRASFDEMARQSELDELRKEVEAMRKGQLADIATHGGASEVNQAFQEINQSLSGVGVQLNSPTSYPYAAAETTMEVKPVAKPRTRKAAAKTRAKSPAKAAAAKKPAARKTVAKAKTPGSKTPAPKAAAKSKAASPKPAAAKKPAAKAAPAKPRTRKATVS